MTKFAVANWTGNNEYDVTVWASEAESVNDDGANAIDRRTVTADESHIIESIREAMGLTDADEIDLDRHGGRGMKTKPKPRKAGRPRRKHPVAILSVKLPVELVAAVRRLALAEGRAINEVVRRALVQYEIQIEAREAGKAV